MKFARRSLVLPWLCGMHSAADPVWLKDGTVLEGEILSEDPHGL